MTALLERLSWWDLPVDEIKALIPLLTDSDLEKVRARLRTMVQKHGQDNHE